MLMPVNSSLTNLYVEDELFIACIDARLRAQKEVQRPEYSCRIRIFLRSKALSNLFQRGELE